MCLVIRKNRICKKTGKVFQYKNEGPFYLSSWIILQGNLTHPSTIYVVPFLEFLWFHLSWKCHNKVHQASVAPCKRYKCYKYVLSFLLVINYRSSIIWVFFFFPRPHTQRSQSINCIVSWFHCWNTTLLTESPCFIQDWSQQHEDWWVQWWWMG